MISRLFVKIAESRIVLYAATGKSLLPQNRTEVIWNGALGGESPRCQCLKFVSHDRIILCK